MIIFEAILLDPFEVKPEHMLIVGKEMNTDENNVEFAMRQIVNMTENGNGALATAIIELSINASAQTGVDMHAFWNVGFATYSLIVASMTAKESQSESMPDAGIRLEGRNDFENIKD